MSATPNEAPRGRFIVLDGVDGAGKSTQIARLAAALRGRGGAVHTTAEPSTWPIGVAIRGHLRAGGGAEPPPWDAMALLFAADRLEHVAREIAPKLAQGIDVLCDRYDASSIAYQSATAPADLDRAAVAAWVATINDHALRPDLTLMFDLDPTESARRRAHRGGPEELYEASALQIEVRARYGEVARLRPLDRIARIDAAGSEDDVHRAVLAAVDALP